jgi:hypothetical protein
VLRESTRSRLLTRGRGRETKLGTCVRYTCERLGERPRLRITKKDFC